MNTLKVILLLSVLSGMLIVIGYLVARGAGVVIALVLSVLMNFGGYWFSDTIVLKMYNARPVVRADAPGLYEAVADLSQKAQIPMPKVYVIASDAPNAFATGRNENHAAVAVTSGLLNLMSRNELRVWSRTTVPHQTQGHPDFDAGGRRRRGVCCRGGPSLSAATRRPFRRRCDSRHRLVAAALVQAAISPREYEADAQRRHHRQSPSPGRALLKLSAAGRSRFRPIRQPRICSSSIRFPVKRSCHGSARTCRSKKSPRGCWRCKARLRRKKIAEGHSCRWNAEWIF